MHLSGNRTCGCGKYLRSIISLVQRHELNCTWLKNLFINKSLFLFPPCSWLPFPPASSSTLECCQVQVVWAGGRSSRRPRCPRHLFRCKTFLFKCTPCAPFRLHFVSNSFLVFFLGLHQVMIISALNQRLNPLHHWHSTCICSYFCIAG